MGRFAELVAKLKSKGEPESEAKGVAAIAGRKKYGKKKFQAMAEAGRKRALAASLELSKNDPLHRKLRRRTYKTAAFLTEGPVGYSTHAAAHTLEGNDKHKLLRRALKTFSAVHLGPVSAAGYLVHRQALKKHLQPKVEDMAASLALSDEQLTDEEFAELLYPVIIDAILRGHLPSDDESYDDCVEAGFELGLIVGDEENGFALSRDIEGLERGLELSETPGYAMPVAKRGYKLGNFRTSHNKIIAHLAKIQRLGSIARKVTGGAALVGAGAIAHHFLTRKSKVAETELSLSDNSPRYKAAAVTGVVSGATGAGLRHLATMKIKNTQKKIRGVGGRMMGSTKKFTTPAEVVGKYGKHLAGRMQTAGKSIASAIVKGPSVAKASGRLIKAVVKKHPAASIAAGLLGAAVVGNTSNALLQDADRRRAAHAIRNS